MIFEIPIGASTATDDGDVTLDVELDGPTYTLRLAYSELSQLWFMDLFLRTATTQIPIALGVPMVTSMPLLIGVQVADRPAGELIISGSVDAGRNDLGSTCKLYYYDADEMAKVLA